MEVNMELKICCDASVKLEKMSNVMEVECNVRDYRLEGDTLNGDIIIRGNYIKDVLEEYHEFNEIVPFTLVFNDKGYVIESISIEDFTCQEIINQGIECNFNILVNYKEGTIPSEVEIDDVDLDDIVDDDYDNNDYDNNDFDDNDNIEEIEFETDEKIIEVSDEDIKKEIDKKYDNLLNEILEARKDQNLLEKNENIAVRSNDVESDCRSILKQIPETYTSYRVYFTNKESDIEKIAKLENISIDKVYKENQELDISNKKRIIIK